MPLDQPIFSEVIEADEQNRAALDELREQVQQWFDALPPRQKDALGAWIDGGTQYDTLVALCAAAGDWNRTRTQELFRLAASQH
jgi:hypothetical protein